MKILFIAPNWLGDFVMSHACLQAIKINYPGASITLMSRHQLKDLASFMPEIQDHVTYPFGSGQFGLKKLFESKKEIQAKNFDIVINTQNSMKSALVPFLSGIKTRIGWVGEQRYFLINDYRANKLKPVKLFSMYQSLAYQKGQTNIKELMPKLEVKPSHEQAVIDKFNIVATKQKVICISVFSTNQKKDWPLERYLVLIRQLQEQNYQIWLLSSPKDYDKLKELNDQLETKCLLFANSTVFDAVVLTSLCELMIAGDSGLLHVASALGKKVIALFGPTNPDETPPLAKYKVIIKPGKAHDIVSMNDIEVNDVFTAVESMMNL